MRAKARWLDDRTGLIAASTRRQTVRRRSLLELAGLLFSGGSPRNFSSHRSPRDNEKFGEPEGRRVLPSTVLTTMIFAMLSQAVEVNISWS